MTRKLEELFNLPAADVLGQATTAEEAVANAKSAEETKTEIANNQTALAAADAAIDKIDAALPTVKDLEASDNEMDAIAKLAQDTFTDLVDLSMNVEPRFSGPILQSASVLLGHALTAKMAKMDKKLKMVDLQLKKARLDQTAEKGGAAVIEGKGMVMDRNELLRSLLNNTPKTDK
jgi:hypothetical protein